MYKRLIYNSYNLLFLLIVISPRTTICQNITFEGKASSEALISNSDQQPFYFWTNKLGQVSVFEKYNLFTHLLASAVYKLQNPSQSFFVSGNINLKYTKNTTINLPEFYGGFTAKYFQIMGGLFADSIRMYGLSPSNSNFMVTQNSAPHPRLRLGSNGFIQLNKKNIFIAGLYEEGVLNDQRVVSEARLHHKNLYLRVGSAERFQITVGLDHFVFWGGYTDEEDYSGTFSDYLKVVFAGKYYVEEKGYTNTVGNQLGQYQVIIRKSFKTFVSTFQISHPFEDFSGVRYSNYPDNMLTLIFSFKKEKFIDKLLFEYTYTKHQSGNPSDTTLNGTGGDNYFSHSQYRSGYTYHGIIMGNPIFGPIKFTEKGIANGPQNNRFYSFHTGISGNPFPALNYKLMMTWSENFGSYSLPYNEPRAQFYSQLSIQYLFTKKRNIFLETSLAFDSGSLWTGQNKCNKGLAFNFGIYL